MTHPSSTSPDRLEEAARAWLAIDPDPATRAETEALLADHDAAGLADRFDGRLAFGTAGLRGPLGAGPLRMNRVVVRQTTAGLARFLLAGDAAPTAVVGYDGRHNSRVFAEDAAAVLAAAGVRAILLPRTLPTPVLAFAVRDLGAAAGVMITASHNPAPDNGYKLYLGGADEGSQLVSPADREVLAAIEAAVADGAGADAGAPDRVEIADDGVLDRYIAATAAIGTRTGALEWVYTPMHGVGLETVLRVLDAAGLPAPSVVEQQAQPDPDFPTAPFPNPEEPGTLDLAMELAIRAGATLVLANDPDADRLAVAVPCGTHWRRLTGNEVGLLLGWRLAGGASASARRGALGCSIVSTPGLARIAAHFGLDAVETLTGFKWISRVPDLVFGFEEALGYLVDPQVVRDKDGISALVVVLATALELQEEGRTLLDLLDEIEEAIGRYDSDQVSIRVDDRAALAGMTAHLRAHPPTTIGGLRVVEADDLAPGSAGLPPTDALRYRLEGRPGGAGARVIVRPSGTEPKLKVYLDVVSAEPTAAERAASTATTLDVLRRAVRPLLGL